MSSQGPAMEPKGPPYIPTTWPLGGANEVNVDVPITAVFLVLFMLGAAAHMTIFQLNQRKGHKFIFSALLFGFCMARITTCILRIASVSLPHDIQLAIAAQIFVAAGVVIIFIVNLVFAQRIIRASHPHIGWTTPFSLFFKFCYALIVVSIIMVITATVQSFFTLNTNTRRIDRDIQLYGSTVFAVLSFLPILMVSLSLAIPRKQTLDKFGAGHWRSKPIILITGAVLVCFGASYRAGTLWLTPVPRTQSLPGYYHKAVFYIVNFTVEILTVGLYAISRVDQRFHVEDGASKRRSYQQSETAQKVDVEAQGANVEAIKSNSEETFNDQKTLVDARKSDGGQKSVENLPMRESKEIYSPLTPVDAEQSIPKPEPVADPTLGKKIQEG